MKSNNRKVTYRYDAFGRRIISKKNGNKTTLICWGDSECAEYKHKNCQRVVQHDIMGHPTRLNSVIARDTARGKRKVKLQWYHKNYLDHVYAVSDDNGNLIEHYRYTAFGEAEIYNTQGQKLAESAIDNDVLWNSRRYDGDTGLYYYKYRHYAAELGRWLGRDPLGDEAFFREYIENTILSKKMTEKEMYRAYTTIHAESLKNEYHFCDNTPFDSFDSQGLNRELVDGWDHDSFILEEWRVQNGKYVSAGFTKWHFTTDHKWKALAGIAVPARVMREVAQGAAAKTTPCQDIETKKMIIKTRKSPGTYHIVWRNCETVAIAWLLSNYPQGKAPPKCCNPDGTEWKR